MAAAKIAVRIKGQTTCLHHKGRQLEFYCEKCQELTCSKCVSTIHKGHLLCDISEIADQRKGDIRNFIDRIEQNDLVQNRRNIASIGVLLKDNDSTFKKLSIQVKKQTEKLKRDLDKLTEETLSVYKKMKEDNIKLIQKYKKDLEIYDNQLKKQMQRCKTALQQGSSFEIYDTECEIDSGIYIPAKPVLDTAIFTPNKNSLNHLKLAFGNAIATGEGRAIHRERSITSSYDQQQPATLQQSKGSGEKAMTVNTLLTETKVVEEWKSPCYISSICPIDDDRAWVSNYGNTIALLDRKGTVNQKVTHTAGINDISLSPTTQRLWACDDENSVLELISGRLSARFRTEEAPRSICATTSNYIIVGMYKHIYKYTTQGQIVLTTAVSWDPIFEPRQMLKECPITHNIAMTHFSEYGSEDEDNRVVVMDTSFQELFVYRGEIPSSHKQISPTGVKPFRPIGMVYDSQGDIIIADGDNQWLLLLSGAGELLKVLTTHTDYARAIGIGRQDVLWLVVESKFRGYHLNILQYSSKS